MAQDFSFDVVSRVDAQELENALNQARKEIAGRFDFKNSKASIEYADDKITVVADDELKLKNVVDIFEAKAVKRGISLKAFAYATPEAAAQQTLRQHVTVRNGISKEQSKPLLDAIKAAKLKVQAQFQDEHIRVSGKNKDDLQKAQHILKALDHELPLQFVNYR